MNHDTYDLFIWKLLQGNMYLKFICITILNCYEFSLQDLEFSAIKVHKINKKYIYLKGFWHTEVLLKTPGSLNYWIFLVQVKKNQLKQIQWQEKQPLSYFSSFLSVACDLVSL